MPSDRFEQAGQAPPSAYRDSENNFGAGARLLDLDAGQMRKESLYGITQPDNDQWPPFRPMRRPARNVPI